MKSGETMQPYPLSNNAVDQIRSKTGKKLNEITMEDILKGNITAEDIKISKKVLKMQGQVAKEHGRPQMERNFIRAGELVDVEDHLILEIYNKLRPNRSTKNELQQYAKLLEEKYNASSCANLIREAADVYERRGILLKEESH